MKTILSIFVVLFVFIASAQNKEQKTKVIEIKTSVICDCHGDLINTLNYTKGIVFAELDLKTQIVSVKYKAKAITDEQVRQIIVNIGYHADNIKRNEVAFTELPECCRDLNAVCTGND